LVWYHDTLASTGSKLSGTRGYPFDHVPETVLQGHDILAKAEYKMFGDEVQLPVQSLKGYLNFSNTSSFHVSGWLCTLLSYTALYPVDLGS
jgi:hypothetical protein